MFVNNNNTKKTNKQKTKQTKNKQTNKKTGGVQNCVSPSTRSHTLSDGRHGCGRGGGGRGRAEEQAVGLSPNLEQTVTLSGRAGSSARQHDDRNSKAKKEVGEM